MNDKNADTTVKVRAIDNENYTTFTLIAVIVPAVAVLLGVLYMVKDNKLDRKLGEHTLSLGILFSILWPVAWLVFTTGVFSTLFGA